MSAPSRVRIKELKDENNDLKTENENLKKQINELKMLLQKERGEVL